VVGGTRSLSGRGEKRKAAFVAWLADLRSIGRYEKWSRVVKEWWDKGLYVPTAKQRAILWEVLDARPQSLIRWINEAPTDDGDGSRYAADHQVLDYVLKQWHAARAAAPVERLKTRRASDPFEWDDSETATLDREERSGILSHREREQLGGFSAD
jgi:hypothetical protein